MKTLLRIIAVTIVLLVGNLYGKLLINEYVTKKPKQQFKPHISENLTQHAEPSVAQLLGRELESLLAEYGEPERVEPSAYGYEWWIYNQNLQSYVQFGIQNHKVVTIYAAGVSANVLPFRIQQTHAEIYEQFPFSYEIALKHENSSYQFELSEEEFNEQPLVALPNGWAQLYFDKFTRELVGVRFMDEEVLLKQRPYQLVYSGELLEPPNLSYSNLVQVEQGNARQVLDLTNVIRLQHELPLLKWDESAAQVAYLHSKDMKEENYFAHESPKYGTLGDRLNKGAVQFKAAGENIAAHYLDAIAAVQGWLNSEGHRKNVLNEQFTNLGVGVHQTFYTDRKSVV